MGSFPGAKARSERDADHSPSSNAEVVNEQELYILSPQAPPWRVAGLLYFLLAPILSHLKPLYAPSQSLEDPF
jgi:hypothetical protein